MSKRLTKADILRYARELRSPFEETQGNGSKAPSLDIQKFRDIISSKLKEMPPAPQVGKVE